MPSDPCPYVRGDTTKHCFLADADIERVQREHRAEMARLRKIEEAARLLHQVFLALDDVDALDEVPGIVVNQMAVLSSRLDQKEQTKVFAQADPNRSEQRDD